MQNTGEASSDKSGLPSGALELRELGESNSRWALAITPSALELQRVDVPDGDIVVVPRVQFLAPVESGEHRLIIRDDEQSLAIGN